jgi:hypothetical protein
MVNRDAHNESKPANRRAKSRLAVSIENQPIPKLPHEHDESVESQAGGRNPPDGKRAPNIGPQMPAKSGPRIRQARKFES